MTESSIVKDNSALHQAVYDAALLVSDLQIKLDTSSTRIAELEQQLVEQYTKFSDLILAGGRLLSEAESRFATLEHALRQAATWFSEYEKHHLAKGDTDKANRNGYRSLFCHAALAPSVTPDASLYGHDGKTPFEGINADDELNAAPQEDGT